MYAHARRLLRKAIAFGLYYSGLLWLYAAFKLHRRVVVLMYHRVLPANADTYSEESIIVTPETFARHLAFLKRYFRPLSLEQLSAALQQGGRLPSRGCLITFDDGWHDNITHALPLLRQYGVPAVVFLATDYVGSESCFWQERLARRMFQAVEREGPARALVEAHTGAGLHLLPAAQRRRVIRGAVTNMKQWPAVEIARYEGEIELALAIAGIRIDANGEDRFMDWSDVARLAPPSPLSAAAHGCSHVPLTTIAAEQVLTELACARERVEAAIGQPISAIAYPNGNYDATVVQLARKAGYRIGFTTQRGLVSERDDALMLRRLNVHDASTKSMPEFLCIILGVFHKWPRSGVETRDADSRYGC